MGNLEWEEVRDQFRTWREDNSRHSEEVIDLWTTCLEAHKENLGDERWMIEEQVFIAGLDCSAFSVSDQCFLNLDVQFPTSLRVLKLKGLRLEAVERYDEALTVYGSLIQDDETNSSARKREIAVLKAQGKTNEAMRSLIEYLKKFMSDSEAWQELSDLYAKEGDYAKAAYCIEELIMSQPHNHLYYTRYAELKYTQGGPDNMELARTYYCRAVKLNPTSVRALYGIVLSCSSSTKITSQKKKELAKLSEWAQRKLVERYSSLKADSQIIRPQSIEDSMATLAITEKGS